MRKVKIEVDEVISFINNNVHCCYLYDCMGQGDKCKGCADYVVDYDEIYNWLEKLRG